MGTCQLSPFSRQILEEALWGTLFLHHSLVPVKIWSSSTLLKVLTDV